MKWSHTVSNDEAPVATTSLVVRNSREYSAPANSWSAYAACPDGFQATGLARVDLLDETDQDNQDVNDFLCDESGCKTWCWNTRCSIISRCASAPGLEVINSGSVTMQPNAWSDYVPCPNGYSVLGLARVDMLDQNGVNNLEEVNDFVCDDSGCKVWCAGSACAVTTRCAAAPGLEVVTGDAITSPADQWGPYAECPPGYYVIGLARIDLLDDNSFASQELNDYRCDDNGCQAWCWNTRCTVQSRCLRISR